MRIVDWEALITRCGTVFVAKMDCGHVQVATEGEVSDGGAVCLECENRVLGATIERLVAMPRAWRRAAILGDE